MLIPLIPVAISATASVATFIGLQTLSERRQKKEAARLAKQRKERMRKVWISTAVLSVVVTTAATLILM